MFERSFLPPNFQSQNVLLRIVLKGTFKVGRHMCYNSITHFVGPYNSNLYHRKWALCSLVYHFYACTWNWEFGRLWINSLSWVCGNVTSIFLLMGTLMNCITNNSAHNSDIRFFRMDLIEEKVVDVENRDRRWFERSECWYIENVYITSLR